MIIVEHRPSHLRGLGVPEVDYPTAKAKGCLEKLSLKQRENPLC